MMISQLAWLVSSFWLILLLNFYSLQSDQPHKILRTHQSPKILLFNSRSVCSSLCKLQPIPPAFMYMFGKDVPNKTIALEAYFGKSAEVEVEKLGKRFYFTDGWSRFVEENHLEHGDFLLFKYFAENSRFKVTIYGKTCCVKQLNEAGDSSKPLNRREDQRNVQEGSKRKRIDDEVLTGTKSCKSEFDRTKAYAGDVIKIESDSSSDYDDQSGKYSELPPDYCNQIQFTSQNPFFQVQLKVSSVNRYLCIPKIFFREHLMMKKKKRMKFEISEKTWDMELQVVQDDSGTKRKMKFAKVDQGWKRLVKEHDLEMGDVCFFEMIRSDDFEFVFRVHVYRWDRQEEAFYKIY